jgi:metal-responsive CopG/Arc/MetJ family transcriptional regulator
MARRRGYSQVNIPDDLLREIDRVVEAGILGYRSRAELIVEAVREKLSAITSLKGSLSALTRHVAGEKTT